MSPPADFWDRVAREVAKLMLDRTMGANKMAASPDYQKMIREAGGAVGIGTAAVGYYGPNLSGVSGANASSYSDGNG